MRLHCAIFHHLSDRLMELTREALWLFAAGIFMHQLLFNLERFNLSSGNDSEWSKKINKLTRINLCNKIGTLQRKNSLAADLAN